MKRIGLLCCLLVLIVTGCSDGDSPLTPTQDVNSAVEATLAPVITLMENGDSASIQNIVFTLPEANMASITYNDYLHAGTGLTISGVLNLVRTISGTKVSLTVTDTVTIEGGTVSELIWNAVATGDYDEVEDDFTDAPDALTGTITADGVSYQFSEFRALMPASSNTGDGPTVTDPHFLVVGSNGTIVLSDNGSEWGWPNVVEAADTGVTVNLSGVASDEAGVSVAVGGEGTILRSVDGVEWTQVSTSITNNLPAVAWSAGHWVTMVNGSEVYHSTDGLTWSAATVTNPTPDYFMDVAGDADGGFVAVGLSLKTMVSSDHGETWTIIEPFNTGQSFHSVVYGGNSTWVAVGESGTIAYSTDTGQTWALATSSGQTNSRLLGVDYGNGKFIAVGFGPPAVLSSTDGDTWTVDTALLPATFVATGNPLADLATDGTGRWSALGGYGDHLLSTDNGASWSVAALDLYGAIAICYRP